MTDTLIDRTAKALPAHVMEKLGQYRFCIVGCGATGGLFAEMLVRTGALHLSLIDGDKIETSNLNRCVSFTSKDCGLNKVDVLRDRLMEVNPEVKKNRTILAFPIHCQPDTYGYDECETSINTRNSLEKADVIILAADDNSARRSVVKYARSLKPTPLILSVGVSIEADGCAAYETRWSPNIPSDDNRQGYGEHGSYISVTAEATAASFNMLLAFLDRGDTGYSSLLRRQSGFAPDGETVSNSAD